CLPIWFCGQRPGAGELGLNLECLVLNIHFGCSRPSPHNSTRTTPPRGATLPGRIECRDGGRESRANPDSDCVPYRTGQSSRLTRIVSPSAVFCHLEGAESGR